VEGKPLAFGQLLVELLALLPAPDRSGQPVARNCFEPHPACPCDQQTQTNSQLFAFCETEH